MLTNASELPPWFRKPPDSYSDCELRSLLLVLVRGSPLPKLVHGQQGDDVSVHEKRWSLAFRRSLRLWFRAGLPRPRSATIPASLRNEHPEVMPTGDPRHPHASHRETRPRLPGPPRRRHRERPGDQATRRPGFGPTSGPATASRGHEADPPQAGRRKRHGRSPHHDAPPFGRIGNSGLASTIRSREMPQHLSAFDGFIGGVSLVQADTSDRVGVLTVKVQDKLHRSTRHGS